MQEWETTELDVCSDKTNCPVIAVLERLVSIANIYIPLTIRRVKIIVILYFINKVEFSLGLFDKKGKNVPIMLKSLFQ